MPRPFLMYPDRRLMGVAAPVMSVDDTLRALWDEMLEAMYAMPGVGLAAPQIGVALRAIVVDASDGARTPLRMANPEIVHASGQMRTHLEGSPNIPGLWAEVDRPRAVTVAYLDEGGQRAERDLVGLWATSVQHQIDHLEGRLFIDRLKPVKRRMLVEKHLKAMKKRERMR
ncbi:peptide deformylase [Halovulum dunhuangense]|uniref:Peptide deformylase-like n=1 Tax=Halovulum dunhuangense TaxID=1505036 RepID=A0A849KZ20_9RHOB|nr:peptide deformylase [Halovulum dunhuangense]NNU79656.1 peptide deformylase [Halovulum dunhuangense]